MLTLCPVEIDGLDPQKREMLEARITGRVSTSTIHVNAKIICHVTREEAKEY